MVVLVSPRILGHIAVERKRGKSALRLVFHDAAVVVDHLHRHLVAAFEVVQHAASLRRIAPPVLVFAPFLFAGQRNGREIGLRVLERLAETTDVVAIFSAKIAHERLPHRLGEVSPGAAGLVPPYIPAEMLAARTARHVDSHQVVAVAVEKMAHGLAVVRRKLLAARERRKRLAHLHSLPPRSIYVPFRRIRGTPPVRRGVEDTRKECGLRRPREKVVDVGVLVRHPERSVLAPVRMPVVRKRAEHRKQLHAGGRHVLCVLLLRLPLPEHHCRNGFPVVVQPRCAVQLRHAPPCAERRHWRLTRISSIPAARRLAARGEPRLHLAGASVAPREKRHQREPCALERRHRRVGDDDRRGRKLGVWRKHCVERPAAVVDAFRAVDERPPLHGEAAAVLRHPVVGLDALHLHRQAQRHGVSAPPRPLDGDVSVGAGN